MTDPVREELAVELQALAHAAAFAITRSSSAGNAITDVHRTLQRISSEVLFKCNSHHRLMFLPQALLHRIFEFFDLQDTLAVSQACKCLRSTCLALPHLWQTDPRRYYGCLTAKEIARLVLHISLRAERSLPHPFDLELEHLENDKPCATLAARFLPRLRSFSASPTSSAGWSAFLDVLKKPAPSLERLKLNCTMVGPNASLTSGSDLLGGQPGSLRSLELHCVSLPLSVGTYPALSTLRSFVWDDQQHLQLDATSLGRILTFLPHLEDLQLCVNSFIWEAWAVETPKPRLLKSFGLYAHASGNVLACSRDLAVSLFRFTSLSGYTQLLDDLVRHPIAVRLGMCTSEVAEDCPGPRPLTVAGDEAMVMVIGPFVRAHLTPALFGALAQLSLYEFFWPSADIALPPLPLLRTLRVTLAPCACYNRYWDPPLGVLLADDLAAWVAPALSSVRFDYWLPTALTCHQRAPRVSQHRGCRERPLTVSLMDIYHFIRVCLPGPRARPLAEIRLRGVDCVDPDPWVAFDLLEGLAEEVSVSDVPDPTQFDIDDQRHAALHRGF